MEDKAYSDSWGQFTTDGIVHDGRAYKLYVPPPAAGSWVLGDSLHFNVAVRPNWFHRKVTKALLGWDWEDAT